MTQVPFDFGREDRLERSERDLGIALRDAVSAIGLTRAAGACEARKQDLSDALNGREGRHIRVSWVIRIAEEAGGEHQRRILDAIARPLGYRAEPDKPLTPEEELALLKAEVRTKFGVAGSDLVAATERTRR